METFIHLIAIYVIFSIIGSFMKGKKQRPSKGGLFDIQSIIDEQKKKANKFKKTKLAKTPIIKEEQKEIPTKKIKKEPVEISPYSKQDKIKAESIDIKTIFKYKELFAPPIAKRRSIHKWRY